MFLALIAGCTNTPVKPGEEDVTLDQHLPLRLAVYMSPEDYALQIQHYYNPRIHFESPRWTEEGKLVRSAALAAFAPLVEQVLPRDEMPMPDLIIRVRGNSFFNPGSQNFYIDVSAACYLPNGKEIGSFQAKWVAKTVIIFHERELEKGYVAAFQDIGRQLLQSGTMSDAMRQRATN
ncbi:MAG TPA: hypothetical protein VLV32_04480 [Burkholderiales bacterium]|nr:hypothetical protein [Burkholderiales bacterium]